MKDIRYTKDYTLRRFLKELKERKLYGKFLIAVSYYNTFGNSQKLKNAYVKDFIEAIASFGTEHMFNGIRNWKRSTEYNDIII